MPTEPMELEPQYDKDVAVPSNICTSHQIHALLACTSVTVFTAVLFLFHPMSAYPPSFPSAIHFSPPSLRSSPAALPSDPTLDVRCRQSLFTYHTALTEWFNGVLPQAEFDSFVSRLSLSKEVELTMPDGQSVRYEDLLQLLKTHHRSEPQGSSHRPDPDTVRMVTVNETTVQVQFHELITEGTTRVVCTTRTQALCTAAPAPAVMGVAWRRIVEQWMGCDDEVR